MNAQQNNYYSLFLKALLYSFAFFFTLGQLQKIELPKGSIYFHDILICLILVAAFFKDANQLFQHVIAKKIAFLKQAPLLTAAIGLVVGQTIYHAVLDTSLTPFLYLIRLCVYTLFIATINKVFSYKTLMVTWFSAVVGFLYLGLLQYIFIPDTRMLASLGWDDHYYRLIGTLFDPAFAGLLFVFGLLMSIWYISKPHIRYLAVIGLSIGLTLTYSRSSWLALLVGLGAIGLYSIYKKRNVRQCIITASCVVATMLATFVFAPKPGGEGVNIARTSTVEARTTAAALALPPVHSVEFYIGRGLFFSQQTTEIPYHPQVPDNSFIMMLSGGGVIALVLYCLGLLQVYQNNQKQFFKNVVLSSLLISSLFNASLIQPFIFITFLGIYTLKTKKDR